MHKNLFIALWVWALITMPILANWAYNEVSCSSNTVFNEFACGQCFDGWTLQQWENISFLDDVWTNSTILEKVVVKEEQSMPKIHELNGSSIIQSHEDSKFWAYTDEFNNLYDASIDGYVLPAGKSVKWIKSNLWASYQVNKTSAKWSAMWILTFDLNTHNILQNWDITTAIEPHRECVLYTSAATPIVSETQTPAPTPTPKPEVPKELPRTWSMTIIIILIGAFLLWFALINKDAIARKLKK